MKKLTYQYTVHYPTVDIPYYFYVEESFEEKIIRTIKYFKGYFGISCSEFMEKYNHSISYKMYRIINDFEINTDINFYDFKNNYKNIIDKYPEKFI